MSSSSPNPEGRGFSITGRTVNALATRSVMPETDRELWEAFRACAIAEGRTVSGALRLLLRTYVKQARRGE